MTQYEEHQLFFEARFAEIKTLGFTPEQEEKFEDFFEQYQHMHDVEPFEVLSDQGRPAVKWTLKNGSIYVVWNDNDTWEYLATRDKSDEKFGYKEEYSYSGGPTFSIVEERNNNRNHHYYCLPDGAEKMIIKKVEWSKDYKPLDRWCVTLEWVTSRYDGTQGGYCRYKNRLHYFHCIEETDLERHRMFAMYHLTTWQRIKAWYTHLKWYISHGNRLLYALNWWNWRDLFGIQRKYSWDFAKKYGEPVAYFTEWRS